jgi:hypothetical protein
MLLHWINDSLVNATSLDSRLTGKCYITRFMNSWKCYMTRFMNEILEMLHHWIYDILENATSLDLRITDNCYSYISGFMTYWYMLYHWINE